MTQELKYIKIDAYPAELQETIIKDVAQYGEWAVAEMLKLAPLQRAITDNSKSANPDIWIQLAFHVIQNLSQEDPNTSHFTVARETLQSQESDGFNDQAVDMLARELVKRCQDFKRAVHSDKYPDNNNSPIFILESDARLDLRPLEDKDGMLWLDDLFLKFIEKIGKWSTNSVNNNWRPKRKQKYIEFLEGESKEMSKVWHLWVSTTSPTMPPYLNILCLCVWKELVKPKWERQRKNTPAIARAVFSPCIKALLSKDNNLIADESGVLIKGSTGQVLATADVATIDTSLLHIIASGLKDMSTLAGHRTYRWLVRCGFENWVNENEDPRLIRTSGGYSGIAELVGCTKPADRQRLKTILYAFAYGNFTLPHGSSGNMIALEIKDRARNGHPTEIDIVLGTMLLPTYVCGLPANDRKLIPVPELPPLVSETASWAPQAMFQLLLLEEFAKRSRELATTGMIHLPDSRLIELAGNAQLSHHTLPKVIDRWSREDGMLEKDGELYTLNKKQFGNELIFLTEQGNRSKFQSERAKRAVKNKKTTKKRKVSKNA